MLLAALMVPLATSDVAVPPAEPTTSEELALCVPVHLQGVGEVCPLPNGHYAVELSDGFVTVTHGADPIPAGGDVGFADDAEQRQPYCADIYAFHVLYGYPSNGPDRTDLVIEDIRDAIRRMNALLNADALESGDVEADYRVRCDEAGEIRVDTFPGPDLGTDAYTQDFDDVVEAARAAGHKDADMDYLIFYDDDSAGVCGAGTLWTDDSLSPNNRNMVETGYGVNYEPCWMGRTPMHENGHNQGAVQQLAPDWDASGHCLEGHDVMCYPTSEFLVLCADRVHFDCDHDTYFDAEPEPGEWLATHWNIGSRVNRFIHFGDQPDDQPAPVEQEELEEQAANETQSGESEEPSEESSESTQTGEEEEPQSESEAGESNSEESSSATDATETVVPDAMDHGGEADDASTKTTPAAGALALLGAVAAGAYLRRRA